MAIAKLQAIDVSMEYYQPRTGKRVLALEGVDLTIEPGEFVSIVGPSGCGKTTFLNIVDGLIKRTGGELLLDGRPIHEPGKDRAVVFQQATLLPWYTVLQNVLSGARCRGEVTPAVVERARELVRIVGLQGFEDNFPGELSGGMQQRVNLARALLVDPELLLMDEPFAALDAQTRELMQAELLRIWGETRKTVLFITHQIEEAIYLSDRVLVFSARPGRVKESVKIEIPRPRDLRVKRTPRFLEYMDRIWDLIESEARRTEEADRLRTGT